MPQARTGVGTLTLTPTLTMRAPVQGPPDLPLMWAGVPTANYTMPGYDAGILNIKFYSDCSRGPAQQRMKTVYPDNYTVLTYCDLGFQYVLGKNGYEAPLCEIWPIYPGTCDVCSCPFCVRQDPEGTWGSQGPGAVTWTSGGEQETSPVGRARARLARHPSQRQHRRALGVRRRGQLACDAVRDLAGLPVDRHAVLRFCDQLQPLS